ncbi:MAG: hypothetical protein H0T46_31470 [Deltaproteobacteria bacterium]|nr:hypothetical protein [Deltaproteobacteria bacterium]
MNRLAYFFVATSLAAGCATDGDDDYPVIPQNGFPTQPGGSAVVGRVCVAEDLRDMGGCSSKRAGGFTVTLGTAMTTTAADGTFLFPPQTDELTTGFTVTGTSTGGLRIVPTSSTFGTNVIVPAIDADRYARLLSSNGVLLQDGTGSILASVTRDGQPATGMRVTSSPASPFGPFYDGSSPDVWSLDGTTTRGMVLIPGLTAGTVDLSYNRILGGLETTVAGVTVRNGGITVVDTQLPGGIP